MRNRPAAKLSLLVALVAGVVLLLALPGQASAATPCWERVLNDWLKDGRIDGTYSVKCYQQALKNAPEDLRDYSNVTDVIQAAMQDAVGSPSGTGTGSGPGGDPSGPPSSDKPRTQQGVPPASYYRRGIDSLGTTQADSLPIPLLVLAGLGSLLLLTAAGLAGAKRIRATRGPKPPPAP
jgi:hypothetical protein